jgi:HSP20 family protein
MTLVKVNNPISKSFDGLFRDFFQEFPSTLSKAVREEVFQFPPVNITEKPDSYLAELAAPGFEKADFKINVEGNTLTISTSKKEEKSESTDKAIRKEYSYKAFQRSFTLDDKINVENITASYENGILKVNLPKREETKPSSKEISIS